MTSLLAPLTAGRLLVGPGIASIELLAPLLVDLQGNASVRVAERLVQEAIQSGDRIRGDLGSVVRAVAWRLREDVIELTTSVPRVDPELAEQVARPLTEQIVIADRIRCPQHSAGLAEVCGACEDAAEASAARVVCAAPLEVLQCWLLLNQITLLSDQLERRGQRY